MYSAKTNGKGSYAWYDRDACPLRQRQELAAGLEGAVERDEIEAYYQPIVALATGRVVGLEALVRWRHPTRGLVLPDASSRSPRRRVHAADRAHDAAPSLRAASRLASRHRSAEELSVSVNLSRASCATPSWTATWRRSCRDGSPAGR